MKTIYFSSAIVAVLLAASAVGQNAVTPAGRASGHFDVRDFGAAGDGKTLDTEAINAAIDAAAAAGGGTVFFPAGTYASFSIHLKSNIALYLDQGATLLAMASPNNGRSPQIAQPPAGETHATNYDPPEPNQWTAYQDFGHSHFHNSLIWGENLHDISILGPGVIDGQGLLSNPGTTQAVGNKALSLKLCRNVTLRDVSFFRGGHFAVLATGVDNFTVDNVKFDTNRDGIDIDSCKNVRVSNTSVNSPTDDGICLKADYALGMPRDCENVTITNCQLTGYAVGTLLDGTYVRPGGEGPTGRIKFGTESNGGFKNITISNCVFDHCRGLAMEAVDGGVIEDITVSNITMREMLNSPVFIRLGNRARGPKESTPVAQIRRINISNLVASGVNKNYPILLSGLPGHPIEDVRLSNIRVDYLGGGTAQDAARVPAENPDKYPEPSMFGVLPASAFYFRHVKGLEMHHVDVTFDKTDARPPLVLEDVQGADFQHMNIQRFDGVPYFSLKDVSNFSTQFVRTVADSKLEKATDGKIGQ